MNLRDALVKLTESDDIKYNLACKVLSVDKTANTCDVMPLNDTVEFFDVRLQAAQSKGLVIYPVVGSVVIVSFLNKIDGYVSLFSQVELYDIASDNESLKALLVDMLAAIKTLTVTTPNGPSGTPINAPAFTSLENRIKKLFK